MKKLFTILGALGIILSSFFLVSFVLAAPTTTYQRNLYPEITSNYSMGTSTKAWGSTTSDRFCLTADTCITLWPTGGGSGGAGGNGFFSATSSFVRPLTVTDGVTTSSLYANQFNVATSTTNNLGLFGVDSSGNTSVSGTLRDFSLATFLGGFISNASSSINNSLQVSGNLSASSTLSVNNLATLLGGFISNASSSINSLLTTQSLLTQGNLNASGTVFLSGVATTTISSFTVNPTATFLGGFISNASSSIGAGLNVNGNLSASSSITIGGNFLPSTTNNSNIGANGLSFANIFSSGTIYAGNNFGASGTLSSGSLGLSGQNVNSYLTANTFNLGEATNFNLGKFYVDSSGDVFASGTLQSSSLATFFGGFISNASSSIQGGLNVNGNLSASSSITLAGNLLANNNVSNLGSYGNAWSNIYTSGTIYMGNAFGSLGTLDASTLNLVGINVNSLLTANTLELGLANGLNVGKFYVDASGNTFTSGTLQATGLSTLLGGFISNASSSVGAGLQVAGNLSASSSITLSGNLLANNNSSNLGGFGNAFANGYASGTFYFGNSFGASGTLNASQLSLSGINVNSYLTANTLNLGEATGFNLGKFYVDGSGNTSVSGTLNISSGFFQTSFSDCSNAVLSKVLWNGSSGQFSCGTDQNGAGSFNGFMTSPLFVTDGTVTSSLYANSFYVATSTTNNLGLFNVDSSGNINSSGTLTVLNSNGTSTVISPTSFTFAKNSHGYNSGLFKIDSSGNITTSGSLKMTSGIFQTSYGIEINAPSYFNRGSTGAGNSVLLTFNAPGPNWGHFYKTNSDVAIFFGSSAGQTTVPEHSFISVGLTTGKVGIDIDNPIDLFSVTSTFSVGATGNTFTSGTLKVYSLSTLTGILDTASSTFTNGLNVTGALNASSSLLITTKSCANGLLSNADGVITGCAASDFRLKQDIKPLTSSNAFDGLKPVFYNWKPEARRDDKLHAGFIAQDVQKVFPAAVVPAGGDYLGVDSNAILSLTVLRVQEQTKKIDSLNKEVKILTNKLNLITNLLTKKQWKK